MGIARLVRLDVDHARRDQSADCLEELRAVLGEVTTTCANRAVDSCVDRVVAVELRDVTGLNGNSEVSLESQNSADGSTLPLSGIAAICPDTAPCRVLGSCRAGRASWSTCGKKSKP